MISAGPADCVQNCPVTEHSAVCLRQVYQNEQISFMNGIQNEEIKTAYQRKTAGGADPQPGERPAKQDLKAARLQIRPAQFSDLDAVCRIEEASFSVPWSRQDYESLIGRENVVFLVICGSVSGGVSVSGEMSRSGGVSVSGKMSRSGGEAGSVEMSVSGEMSGPGGVTEPGAMTDEEIIGYGTVQLAADEGDLLSIAVRADCRGTGAGAALLGSLLRESEELGCERIFLEVRKSNTPAVRMYEKAGFRQIGIRKKYYTRPVEDALLLRRCREEREDVRNGI